MSRPSATSSTAELPQPLNLGTGQRRIGREVIRTVEAVTGRKVPVREEPRRAGDPPALVADPRRAEALLRWRARADLAAMVEDAWRWHRKLHGRAGGQDRALSRAATLSK